MGSACSTVSDLTHNDYLKRLCSGDCISENDPFWNALLAFSPNESGLSSLRSSDAKLLEDTVAGLCRNFSINNQRTRNLNTFVRAVVKRYTQLRNLDVSFMDENPLVWQMANALLIVRIICKYHFENLSADLAIEQFCDLETQSVSCRSEPQIITDLMLLLTDVMLEVPVSSSTLRLHFEVVNLFIILLSCYMFHSEASNVVFYTYLMGERPGDGVAAKMLRTLLCRSVSWRSMPAERAGDEGRASLGSSLLSLLTVGYFQARSEPVDCRQELGARCLALLLVLVNHSSPEDVGANPYRVALGSFLDVKSLSVGAPVVVAAQVAFDHVTFDDVYRYLCSELVRSPPAALLAYMLIHENQSFRTYVLSRAEPEHIVLPLLAVLRGGSSVQHAPADAEPSMSYGSSNRDVGDGGSPFASGTAAHHVYISLIILLMLSEDDGFASSFATARLDDCPSPCLPLDELPAGASLADAVVHVLLRSLRRNMTCSRDHYLHTNCLAVLANLSARLSSLHPAVCKTLVAFLSMLVRRHGRLKSELQLAELGSTTTAVLGRVAPVDEDDSQAGFGCLGPGAVAEQLSEGAAIIEEVLQMFVEILDSCLFHTLHQNVSLVHTMLCERQLFDRIFKVLPADAAAEAIADIRSLLDYFLARLPDGGSSPSSATTVAHGIESSARTFRASAHKKPPELRFRYVEEADRERFFVPYVWSLVCSFTGLYFNPSKIKLRLP